MQRARWVMSIVLTAASTAAPAKSSSSAYLGDFTIRLFDLTPGGGGTPWIKFTDPDAGDPSGTNVFSYAFDSGTSTSESDSAFGSGLFTPVSVSSSVLGSHAAGTVSGRGVLVGSKFEAAGTTWGSSANGTGGFNAYAQTPSGAYYWNLSVSPYTTVVISATSTLAAAVTNKFNPGSTGFESASAQTKLEISGPGPAGSGSQTSSVDRLIGVHSQMVDGPQCPSGPCYVGQSLSETMTVAGSFVNFSADAMMGHFQASASAYGGSSAPVPEPSSIAMILAGLGTFALVRRRGRR